MEASPHAARAPDDAPAMSLEQLKEGMFQSIRDTGTVELIRAQLRRRFIEKLRQQNGTTRGDERREHDREDGVNKVGGDVEVAPDEKLVHGLVVEFLVTRNLENSLAVFVPEIGGARNQVDSATILKMLQLSPDTLQQFELKRVQTGSSLLSVLVQELVRRCQLAKMDSGTQTAMDCFDHRIVLENQLRRVENTYMEERAAQKQTPQQSLEERMISYQREYDAICDKRLEDEMKRYKATEVAMVRAEERKKFNREVDALRSTLFQEYRDKLDRLQEREREMELAFVAKRAELETSLFETRQSLFKEMERLRVKEAELQVKVESDFRHFSSETQRFQLWEENVRVQEANLESMVAQAMTEKERAWKLERQKELHDSQQRQDELIERESALDIEIGTRKEMKIRTSALQQENAALEAALSKSNDDLRIAQQMAARLEKEKQRLEEGVVQMETRIAEEEHTLRDANSASVRLAAEKGTLEDEVIRYKQRTAEAEALLKQTTADVNALQQQVLTLKLNEASGVAEERKKFMGVLDEERDRFHWKEGELVAKLRDTQSRLAETEALAEKYQSQYEDEKVHVESLRHDVSSLNSLLKQAQATIIAKHGTARELASLRSQRNNVSSSDGKVASCNSPSFRDAGSEHAFMMKIMQMMAGLRDGTIQQEPPSRLSQGAESNNSISIQNGEAQPTAPAAPSHNAEEDEEGRRLKEDQARIERDLLEKREHEKREHEKREHEKREHEKRKQTMMEKQEREIAEWQKQFDEELARKRQESLEEEERLGEERRKRIAEGESRLQEELAKQRVALQDATTRQAQMAEQRLDEERQRLQEQHAYDERRRAEEVRFAEEVEVKRLKQQLQEKAEQVQQEVEVQEAIRRQEQEKVKEEAHQQRVAAQREVEVSRQDDVKVEDLQKASHEGAVVSDVAGEEDKDADPGSDCVASDCGYAHFESLDAVSEQESEETAKPGEGVESEVAETRSAGGEHNQEKPTRIEGHSTPATLLDVASDKEAGPTEVISDVETHTPIADGTAAETPDADSDALSELEAGNPCDDIDGVSEAGIIHEDLATGSPAVSDTPAKTPEELEEEKLRTAEEEKKKQDEAEIDAYRQRVLTRKAAEKERQRELEASAERERQAEAEAVRNQQYCLGHPSDSDEELELSGGSFAESRLRRVSFQSTALPRRRMASGADARASRRPAPRQLDMSEWNADASPSYRERDRGRDTSPRSSTSSYNYGATNTQVPRNRYDPAPREVFPWQRSPSEGQQPRGTPVSRTPGFTFRTSIREGYAGTTRTSSGSSAETLSTTTESSTLPSSDGSFGSKYLSSRSDSRTVRDNQTEAEGARGASSNSFEGSIAWDRQKSKWGSRMETIAARSTDTSSFSVRRYQDAPSSVGTLSSTLERQSFDSLSPMLDRRGHVTPSESSSSHKCGSEAMWRGERCLSSPTTIRTSSPRSMVENNYASSERELSAVRGNADFASGTRQDEPSSPTNSERSVPPASRDDDRESFMSANEFRRPELATASPPDSVHTSVAEPQASSPCSSVSTSMQKLCVTTRTTSTTPMTERREELYAFRKEMREVFIRVEDMVDVHRSFFRTDPSSGVPVFDPKVQRKAEQLADETFEQLAKLRTRFSRLATSFNEPEDGSKKSDKGEKRSWCPPTNHSDRCPRSKANMLDSPDSDAESTGSAESAAQSQARDHHPAFRDDRRGRHTMDSATRYTPSLLRSGGARLPAPSDRSSRSTPTFSQLHSLRTGDRNDKAELESDVSSETTPPRPRFGGSATSTASSPTQSSFEEHKARETGAGSVFQDFDKRMEEIRSSLNAIASTRSTSTGRADWRNSKRGSSSQRSTYTERDAAQTGSSLFETSSGISSELDGDSHQVRPGRSSGAGRGDREAELHKLLGQLNQLNTGHDSDGDSDGDSD